MLLNQIVVLIPSRELAQFDEIITDDNFSAHYD